MQHQSQSLATSGMQMLPQEVAENIFNALDGDAATLSSCLHVSRVWAALSYPVRFRRVAFSALAAVAEKNLGPRTFDDFLVLLRQSPRLCQCIRELTFRSQSEAGIFDTAVLQSIISRLPFLTTLDIAATSLWPTQTIPHDLAQPVRLRKLTISEDCLWMSQESLASLLNLFDEIDEITHFVSSMPMEHKPGFTVMRPSSNKLEVKSLTFVHGHRPLITKAVESCLTVYSQLLNKNTLTNFSIDPGHLSPDELRAYGRFIAEFGRNVTDFHYGVYRRGNAVDGADIISNFPADAQPGVLTAQYSVGLEFSWWFQRVVTCGWDSAVAGLVRAPSSVRTMRLTLETTERFFPSFIGSCISPAEGLFKLLDTLDWQSIQSAIEGHRSLETLQVELQAAGCSEIDHETFEKECEDLVLSRFVENARVTKALRVIVV